MKRYSVWTYIYGFILLLLTIGAVTLTSSLVMADWKPDPHAEGFSPGMQLLCGTCPFYLVYFLSLLVFVPKLIKSTKIEKMVEFPAQNTPGESPLVEKVSAKGNTKYVLRLLMAFVFFVLACMVLFFIFAIIPIR